MGRPPMGKRAMTPAEKQRRYRERKFGNKPPVTKPPAKSDAAAQAEIAALKARIAELDAQEPATKTRGATALSMTAQERLEAAIRAHKARFDRMAQQMISDEVRRRIAAADDFARAENKKLNAENMQFRQILNQGCVFTEREFGQLLMCVHPDNTASVNVRNEMLRLLVANKRRLIKEVKDTRAARR